MYINFYYTNKALTLVANNLTAIASKTTPKTLRMMLNPVTPRNFSIFEDDFKTPYTKTIFKKIAIIILISWYCAFNESKVVIVPVPAIKGKAIGTIDAVLASSSRYNLIPRIISKAKKNNTNEPATANEFTEIPIKFSNSFPINKKVIMIKNDTIVAFSD